MSNLSTLALWILILFFVDLITSKDKQIPKQSIPLLNFQKERSTQDPSETFWKRLFKKNESIKTVGLRYLNKTLHCNNGEIDKIVNNEKHKSSMKNINRKTLMDYNDPAIIDDLDSESDQDLATYVRVKRNGLTINDSIGSHHSINFTDSFPQNIWSKPDAINALNNSISKYKGSNIDSDYRNQSDICSTVVDILHSRHSRGILSNTGDRRKRVKGSNRHSKHHIKTQVRNKKHDTLESFHKPIIKKANKRRSKKSDAQVSTKPVGESQIEKRESKNSSLNTVSYKNIEDLIDSNKNESLTHRSFNKQGENTIVLPLVQMGKAELRVRLEKIITNETSSSKPDNSVNYSAEIGSYSTVSNWETINEVTETFITNLEATTNFDSKPYPVEFNFKISEDQNSENENYDHATKMSVESSDENTKSRAKRHQEVASKHSSHNDDINTIEDSKHIERKTLVVDRKEEGTKYKRTCGDHAIRSIEEIKVLAKNLIVKINELQTYVNNKTVNMMNFCIDKKANCATIIKTPKISLEKHILNSKIGRNVDNYQRLATNSKQTSLAGRTSLVSFSGSRFPPIQSRTRRKLQRKWGRWMDWSSCSVTCGKGRQIRWRHCLRDCDDAETEMEEKACQLPACPPGKFLGIF
ncbi:uncharacterized protein LOC109863847 isoform X3 [Pseudomyrmex gracilis]|uniref:uncharacterized protein LOC109863847 isoform X3 n=1 Tax=Pseudomyrmex gracilis TaxID=219809 RepID=UPI000994BDE1|nr:uncharacterized protein LOC109863847 isoform X3 [Pseudomyrmex gracilis]